MPRPKESEHPKRPAGRTPEAIENHMISLAINQAEKQLLEGTAPAQIVTHFLKLATEKEKLEMELLRARTESIASAQRIEELYQEAINAMRKYGGVDEQGV